MVNEEKQIFHCFGCGEGGDVFTFLMKMAHLSFPQAVEEVAKRYGVRIFPRELSRARKEEISRRELLLQINQIASDYFHEILLTRKEAEEARQYLSRRGIGRQVIEEHRLGYSLGLWNSLVQHLQAKKVSLEMAQELGLILPKRREGWYDTFRGRIIFPIFDLQHRPVGFGGRLIQEGEPKYLNSAESSLYHKGETLYGLQVAKRHIAEKDCVLIVEGYFDLLTLHQNGMKNSVATLGTALTVQHIRILKRYTENLVTIFDGDSAGIQANLRALPLFLEEAVWPKTVLLPKGEDPDGYLRKGNREAFETKVSQAIPLFDFFFEHLGKTYDLGSMKGKVKIVEEGIALVRRIPEGIRRSFYLKALAEKVGLQETVLHEILRSPAKPLARPEKGEQKPSGERTFPKAEEMIVSLMIQHPEWIPQIAREGVVGEFESTLLRRIAESLQDLYHRKGRLDLTEALDLLEENFQGLLRTLIFQENGLEKVSHEKILNDCIRRVHEGKLKRDRVELLKRIKEAERQEGGPELESLLRAQQELMKRQSRLRAAPFEKA